MIIKYSRMKKKIKKWLGITKLENDNAQLRKRLELHRTHSSHITTKFTESEARTKAAEASARSSSKIAMSAADRVEKLADVFAVGMDWSPSGYDRSWIVVCIKGKMERVQFMDVSDKNAREIREYLSIFNKDNVTIDAGPGPNFFTQK